MNPKVLKTWILTFRLIFCKLIKMFNFDEYGSTEISGKDLNLTDLASD